MIIVEPFAICGDWDTTPTPNGLHRIVMPPLGAVFGAGWHPHTQTGLRAVAAHVRPGMTFAEVGAGSGILCVAAKLVGAGECYATEINPDALAAARRVFAANGVDVTLIEGTFPPTWVDVALVSISTDFAKRDSAQVKAARIVAILDDGSVEVVR